VDHFRRDCLECSYSRCLGRRSRSIHDGFYCSGPRTGLGLASSVSKACDELPLFPAHLYILLLWLCKMKQSYLRGSAPNLRI
jgi:hypothetical protein